MASGGTDNSLECPICLDNFTDPKILPCGHTACLHCLEGLVRPFNKFRCPVCRLDIDVPEGGMDTLVTVFALMNIHKSPKCATHKKEKVVLFCNDCYVGICVVCLVEDHRAHNYVYVDDETVKQDTIQKLQSNRKKIEYKIQDLEKTHQILEDQSKNLNDYDKNGWDRVVESYNRKLKELEEKKKNALAKIDDVYNKNKLKLSASSNQCQQQKQALTQVLKRSMPSLQDGNDLKRLKCVNIMSDLELNCNDIEVKVPHDIQYLVWKGDDKSLPDDVLGVSEHETLYIPFINDFRFNINDIKDLNKDYYSPDKYNNNGIIWSCCVQKYYNGYLGVFSEVRKEDNPKLDSCVIDDQFTLVNKVRDQSIIQKSQNYTHKTGFGRGWSTFILWRDLCYNTKGFVDTRGQFIVKLDINNVRNITNKQIKTNKINIEYMYMLM